LSVFTSSLSKFIRWTFDPHHHRFRFCIAIGFTRY
jgi:hypothetical protein